MCRCVVKSISLCIYKVGSLKLCVYSESRHSLQHFFQRWKIRRVTSIGVLSQFTISNYSREKNACAKISMSQFPETVNTLLYITKGTFLVRILRWGDYPRIFRCNWHNCKGPYMTTSMAEESEAGRRCHKKASTAHRWLCEMATNQEMWKVSRIGKKQEKQILP